MTVYLFCLFISASFLIMTFYFIKKRKLEFKYGMLWIGMGLLMLVLSIDKNLTEGLASFLKISYPPAFLFLSGIIFTLLLVFHGTITISSMQERIVKLTQEIGIIKNSMDKEESIK